MSTDSTTAAEELSKLIQALANDVDRLRRHKAVAEESRRMRLQRDRPSGVEHSDDAYDSAYRTHLNGHVQLTPDEQNACSIAPDSGKQPSSEDGASTPRAVWDEKRQLWVHHGKPHAPHPPKQDGPPPIDWSSEDLMGDLGASLLREDDACAPPPREHDEARPSAAERWFPHRAYVLGKRCIHLLHRLHSTAGSDQLKRELGTNWGHAAALLGTLRRQCRETQAALNRLTTVPYDWTDTRPWVSFDENYANLWDTWGSIVDLDSLRSDAPPSPPNEIERPTRPVSMKYASVNWFGWGPDTRQLKSAIEAGTIRVKRCTPNGRKWFFDLDDVVRINPEADGDADPTRADSAQ
ncbi:hypothetical protein ACERK3_01495 [Phycisphaerales bacterium AB-hyl4]|uniref:Uncharacterized protein n=1 Tax=Natronomicrosphaera hydrolytica TaxID=3242702 RepID=A0ABV4U029_9BACT